MIDLLACLKGYFAFTRALGGFHGGGEGSLGEGSSHDMLLR
jgi:hypothetical protein